MDLYVVRHAPAGSANPARWPDDADRPLTAEGVEEFRRAARGLRQFAAPADLVLSSPAARAWRTAEILAEEASWPAPEPLDILWQPVSSPVLGVLEALRPHAGLAAVAIVGHDPMVSQIVSHLFAGESGRPRVEMEKGAVACLRLGRDPRTGSAMLRWYAPPEMLAARA